MPIHSTMSGLEIHQPFHYEQDADPGAVGINKYWYAPTSKTLRRRNDDNTSWIILFAPSAGNFLELTDSPNSYTGQAGKFVRVTNDETALEFSTVSGGGLQKLIEQTAHALPAFTVVYLNGSTYTPAKADDAATAEVVGIISSVPDANHFVLTLGGEITGLSGLTPGNVYFLSPLAAGTLTGVAPDTDGHVSKPILIASSATTGYLFNFRGLIVGSSEGGGGGGGGINIVGNTSRWLLPPSSPNAFNEEMEAAMNGAWSFNTNSGGIVNGTCFPMEYLPAVGVRYNVNSDIPGALVFNANSSFQAKRTFVPPVSENWCCAIRLFSQIIPHSDSGIYLLLSVQDPAVASFYTNDSVTIGIHRTGGADLGIRTFAFSAGGYQGDQRLWYKGDESLCFGFSYNAALNYLGVWVSRDGTTWSNVRTYTSGGFLNAIQYMSIFAGGCSGAVDFVRFNPGSQELRTLGQAVTLIPDESTQLEAATVVPDVDTPPLAPDPFDDEFVDSQTLPGGSSPKWVWSNQQGASASIVKNGLAFIGANVSVSLVYLYQTVVLAGDWEFTMKFSMNNQSSGNEGVSLCLSDGTKIYSFESGGWGSIFLTRWTNSTTYGSNIVNTNRNCPRICYFRIRCIGGTLHFEWSPDGHLFASIHSEAIGTYIGTVTRVGVGMFNNFSSTSPIKSTIYWIRKTI